VRVGSSADRVEHERCVDGDSVGAISPQVVTDAERAEHKRCYIKQKRERARRYEAARLIRQNERHKKRNESARAHERTGDAEDEANGGLDSRTGEFGPVQASIGTDDCRFDDVAAAIEDFVPIQVNLGVNDFRFDYVDSEWVYAEPGGDDMVEVEPSSTGDERGIGLRSRVTVIKGEFVIEYVGELLDDLRVLQTTNKAYLLQFKDRAEYCGRKTNVYVDPCYYGNLARYINHHCDPNCIADFIPDGFKRRVADHDANDDAIRDKKHHHKI
jgi:hypothetical protein